MRWRLAAEFTDRDPGEAGPGTSEPAGDGYTEAVTRQWIRSFVIDLNLCPFARREFDDDRVRIAVTPVRAEAELLEVLNSELDHLAETANLETTVVVHPQVLTDFDAYLDFLPLADELLVARGEEGIFQIASFHPDYCFEDSADDDAPNFSNRSPYPMLHLLRESSVERAVANHPDAASIPERNIEVLRMLGAGELDRRWRQCFDV